MAENNQNNDLEKILKKTSGLTRRRFLALSGAAAYIALVLGIGISYCERPIRIGDQPYKESLEEHLSALEPYLQEKKDKWVEDLKYFLSIESVSWKKLNLEDYQKLNPQEKKQQEGAKAAGRKAAEYLVNEVLGRRHISAKILENPEGNPVVFGEIKSSEKAPTVLIYCHYDVQPAGEWKEAFQPQLKKTVLDLHGQKVNDMRIYARGVSDDKGQLLTHLFAIETYLRHFGKLPVNIKFLIDGGEEMGSPGLDKIVEKNASLLKSDMIIVSDNENKRMEVPALTTTFRGILGVNMEVTTANKELHSGYYGGLADNAMNIMVEVLSRLKNPNTHKVLIDGFYQNLRPLTEKERGEINQCYFIKEEVMRQYQLSREIGEAGYSPLERMWRRPTLDIHAVSGGVEGNSLIAKVKSYFSMRLGEGQKPDEVYSLLNKQLEKISKELGLPEGTIKTTPRMKAEPLTLKRGGPLYEAAEEAIKHTFKSKTIDYMGNGGSEAIASIFSRVLKVPIFANGYGSPYDNAHAPNESFLVEHGFMQGIRTNLAMYYNLGKVKNF